MTSIRRHAILGYGLGICTLLVTLSGCMYNQIKKLPPDAQAEFRIYRKVMNAPQMRTYLSKATADDRTAYLEQIGMAQRFQALNEEDQKAVQRGYIRTGMSAEALRFLWGRPTRYAGNSDIYAHWYYNGSIPTLVAEGSQWDDAGTLVDVYLVDNRVKWWLEQVPPDIDRDSDSEGFRR